MSQRVVSTKVEKTCEGCGKVELIEMVEEKTPEQIADLSKWITHIREVYDERTGRFEKIMVQSCSISCSVAAQAKLFQVAQDPEQGDSIDLSKLQVGEPVN